MLRAGDDLPLDADLARDQAQWFVVGLGCFSRDDRLLRDYQRLERYRYLIARVARLLLLLPRSWHPPGQRRLPLVKVGSVTFQPAEFAKIGFVIFLASYLRDTRQVLVLGARRFPA